MKTMGKLVNAIALLGVGALVGAAVAKELRTPVGERTWEGGVVGVPYDFRPPTTSRIRACWWNPDDPRVITPHAFGVGWTVNAGRVVRIARERDWFANGTAQQRTAAATSGRFS